MKPKIKHYATLTSITANERLTTNFVANVNKQGKTCFGGQYIYSLSYQKVMVCFHIKYLITLSCYLITNIDIKNAALFVINNKWLTSILT